CDEGGLKHSPAARFSRSPLPPLLFRRSRFVDHQHICARIMLFSKERNVTDDKSLHTHVLHRRNTYLLCTTHTV
ncbi:hypothetical protein CSUI_005414, partial [Cystoisospora suis]